MCTNMLHLELRVQDIPVMTGACVQLPCGDIDQLFQEIDLI